MTTIKKSLKSIIGVSALFIILFIFAPEEVRRFFNDESTFKITYQFLLITIIGGAVAYLYKLLEVDRERRKDLRDMHAELLGAFNKAKTVRREIRAHVGVIDRCINEKGHKSEGRINDKGYIRKDIYVDCMAKLNQAQLVYEVYSKRAENSALWFEDSKEFESNVRMIEKYLNNILKEYQTELHLFDPDSEIQEISNFETLLEFISPFKDDSDFDLNFKKPGDGALISLSKLMLK